MTFSLLARCPRTGKLGIATATSSLAVGARVCHARAERGVVAIMAVADTRLGHKALGFLELGRDAQGVIDALVAGDPDAEYRQLAVVDAHGSAAVRTGRHNRDWAGHRVGASHVALGNFLTAPKVIEAMETAFLARPDDELEDRLMCAIEAGRDAGGQHGGQRSAALLVYAEHAFAHVDLRVDVHDEPVGELRRVYDAYRPAIPYYTLRQLDPRVPRLDEWLREHANRGAR